MVRHLEPVLWLALAIFVLARFGPQLQAWTGIGPAPVGQVPPELVISTLEGTTLGPAEREGRIQVVTFWATWCRVCRFELPAVQRVHETWAGTGEVMVVGISIDQGGEALVRAHADAHGYTFPQAMAGGPVAGSGRGAAGHGVVDLRRAFGGIHGVPTTFLVDRDGRIRYTLVGVSGPGTLQRAVRRLVEEEASEGASGASGAAPEAAEAAPEAAEAVPEAA
jgi:cytochrome c biogenesis protein CcmG, thiol:disulfide interchange protein DsbE